MGSVGSVDGDMSAHKPQDALAALAALIDILGRDDDEGMSIDLDVAIEQAGGLRDVSNADDVTVGHVVWASLCGRSSSRWGLGPRYPTSTGRSTRSSGTSQSRSW